MSLTVAEAAERGIRYGILAVCLVALRQRKPSAVVNALLALAGTYLPDVVENATAYEFRPWQRAYASAAMLMHSIGMLGPYDDVWWWDHVTHTHSATLLGGLTHVVARDNGRDPRPRVLAVVLGGGVFWELFEYVIHVVANRLNLEPLLISYGKRDTYLDLCFDLLGALIVVVFGDWLLGDGEE